MSFDIDDDCAQCQQARLFELLKNFFFLTERSYSKIHQLVFAQAEKQLWFACLHVLKKRKKVFVFLLFQNLHWLSLNWYKFRSTGCTMLNSLLNVFRKKKLFFKVFPYEGKSFLKAILLQETSNHFFRSCRKFYKSLLGLPPLLL